MKRADILQTAEKCVCGKREQDYGKPENNFQAIADLWNAYLNGSGFYITNIERDAEGHLKHRQLSAFDVAMLMALLKVGRIATGTATDDSFVDACGYLACGGEIMENTHEFNRAVENGNVQYVNDVIHDDRDPGSGAKQY